jgi:hypothetical protein
VTKFGIVLPSFESSQGGDEPDSPIKRSLQLCQEGWRETTGPDTTRTLHSDTSHDSLFEGAETHAEIRDEGFRTIESLRDMMASLRHLSISADNIYFPSLYPRVLLRDQNTDGTNPNTREKENVARR